jgi:hypothetical protein
MNIELGIFGQYKANIRNLVVISFGLVLLILNFFLSYHKNHVFPPTIIIPYILLTVYILILVTEVIETKNFIKKSIERYDKKMDEFVNKIIVHENLILKVERIFTDTFGSIPTLYFLEQIDLFNFMYLDQENDQVKAVIHHELFKRFKTTFESFPQIETKFQTQTIINPTLNSETMEAVELGTLSSQC